MNIPDEAIEAAARVISGETSEGWARICEEIQPMAAHYRADARSALQAAAPFLIEECAKACEKQADDFLSPQMPNPSSNMLVLGMGCFDCAKAIRALTQESKENNAK